jgi:hypothetical protein
MPTIKKKKIDVILVTRCHCHRVWDTAVSAKNLPEVIDIPLSTEMKDYLVDYKTNIRSFGLDGYDKENKAFMYYEIK